MTERNKRCSKKTFSWWIGNIVFGLIPLISVWLVKILHITKKSTEIAGKDFTHQFNDGIINFFCLALIGSIAVDTYSSRRHFKNEYNNFMNWGAAGAAFGTIIYYLIFVLTSDSTEHFGDNMTYLCLGDLIGHLLYGWEI